MVNCKKSGDDLVRALVNFAAVARVGKHGQMSYRLRTALSLSPSLELGTVHLGRPVWSLCCAVPWVRQWLEPRRGRSRHKTVRYGIIPRQTVGILPRRPFRGNDPGGWSKVGGGGSCIYGVFIHALGAICGGDVAEAAFLGAQDLLGRLLGRQLMIGGVRGSACSLIRQLIEWSGHRWLRMTCMESSSGDRRSRISIAVRVASACSYVGVCPKVRSCMSLDRVRGELR